MTFILKGSSRECLGVRVWNGTTICVHLPSLFISQNNKSTCRQGGLRIWTQIVKFFQRRFLKEALSLSRSSPRQWQLHCTNTVVSRNASAFLWEDAVFVFPPPAHLSGLKWARSHWNDAPSMQDQDLQHLNQRLRTLRRCTDENVDVWFILLLFVFFT